MSNAPLDVFDGIIGGYREAFSRKDFGDELPVSDLLMDAFGITPETKRENAQYWGRELGSVWQRLVFESFKHVDKSTRTPPKQCPVHPCDVVTRGFGIEVKYRIGSGDAPFIKNLEANASVFTARGESPVLLVFREDSLATNIKRAGRAGWTVKAGAESLAFLLEHTGCDLEAFLRDKAADLAL